MRNRFNLNFETWSKLLALRWRVCFGESIQVVEDHLNHNFRTESPKLDEEELDPSQISKIRDYVIEKYKKLNGDYNSSVMEFLKICKELDLYFAHIFPVSLSIRKE